MTDPRDNHSIISSLLNSLMSSPKLKKAAGVFVAAFVGAIAVNGFTGNGITNAFRHATQETMKSVKGGAGAPAALPGQNPTATGSTAGLPDSTANAGAQEVQGQVVKVADGDTITLKKTDGQTIRIRFLGIDAPEHDQAGGPASKAHLESLVAGRNVTVRYRNLDQYGRTVGKVLVDGKDINLSQLQTGNAWFYRSYQKSMFPEDRPIYEAAEEKARSEHIGLWSEANPTPPWDFRKAKRSGSDKGFF